MDVQVWKMEYFFCILILWCLWWDFFKFIMLSFRSLSTSQRSREIPRFILYVLFALGVPSTIVTVGKVLDVLYRYTPFWILWMCVYQWSIFCPQIKYSWCVLCRDDPENELIVPRYGETKCLVDDSAELPYLYGPIGFLLTCNFFFFAATLYYFLRNERFAKSNTSPATSSGHTVKYR